MKLIDKDIIIREIDRRIVGFKEVLKTCDLDVTKTAINGLIKSYESLKLFIDTIEVREVHEHDDYDIDKIIEEIGIKPDSRLANMAKNAFYRGLDNYLVKKGE